MNVSIRTGSFFAIAAITSACNLSSGGSSSPLPAPPTSDLVGHWVNVESIVTKDGKESRTSLSGQYDPELFVVLSFESPNHGSGKITMIQEEKTCETSVDFTVTYPTTGVMVLTGGRSQQTGDTKLGCPAEKVDGPGTFRFKVSGNNLELQMDVESVTIGSIYKRVQSIGEGVPFQLAELNGRGMNAYATIKSADWATAIIPANRLNYAQRKCIRRQEKEIREVLGAENSRLAELMSKKAISTIDVALVDMSSEPDSVPHETHQGIRTGEYKGKLAVHPSLKGNDCEILKDEDLEALAAEKLRKS